jgi:hypothetical protein
MRIMQTKTRPAEKHEECVAVVCGMCGKEYRHAEPSFHEGVNWAKGPYDVHETSLRLTEGSNYPEGGRKTIRYADICPHCMEHKVFLWLVSQGVKIEEEETD